MHIYNHPLFLEEEMKRQANEIKQKELQLAMAGLVEKAKQIKESSGQPDPKVNQQPEQTQEPDLQIVIEPQAPKDVEPELQIVIQPQEQMSKL